jgi:hypothetical protein
LSKYPNAQSYGWRWGYQAKFSLSGNTLTFEATSFKNPGDNTYQVNIKATKGNDTTEKTLTVTVEASTRAGVGASRAVAIRMAAQAVRKESKTASKVLLFKVGKTLMGRLSHIRHKDKQKSSSSANGFVSGIQVSFADSQTNSLINHVLTRIFKAGGFKGKCVATKAEFSLISATSNRGTCHYYD